MKIILANKNARDFCAVVGAITSLINKKLIKAEELSIIGEDTHNTRQTDEEEIKNSLKLLAHICLKENQKYDYIISIRRVPMKTEDSYRLNTVVIIQDKEEYQFTTTIVGPQISEKIYIYMSSGNSLETIIEQLDPEGNSLFSKRMNDTLPVSTAIENIMTDHLYDSIKDKIEKQIKKK